MNQVIGLKHQNFWFEKTTGNDRIVNVSLWVRDKFKAISRGESCPFFDLSDVYPACSLNGVKWTDITRLWSDFTNYWHCKLLGSLI